MGLVAMASLGASEPFVIDDQVITDPRFVVQDYEFNHIDGRITWQDKIGQLWIADVDPVTGAFIPITGQGRLIDTGLAGISDSGNGPEWAYSNLGQQIVYTKYTSIQRDRFMLARARNVGGNWFPELVPGGIDGYAPIGSLEPNDPDPRIKYQLGSPANGSQGLAWKSLATGAGAILPDPTSDAGRWVEGRRALIISILVDNIRQAAYYDIDTNVITQLTFDATQKNNLFMWKAPEYNNELIFMAAVNAQAINIYRQINGVWTVINSLVPPNARPYLLSPEYFVYNGKSYVFTLASDGKKTSDRELSDVWLMAADPTAPLFRQVSRLDKTMVRADPEYFITTLGPWIYYSQRAGAKRIIHRCSTGLGPGQ